MPTINRGYPELPANVNPDVPHYVNLALRRIDADVELLDLHNQAENTNIRKELAVVDARKVDAAKELVDATKKLNAVSGDAQSARISADAAAVSAELSKNGAQANDKGVAGFLKTRDTETFTELSGIIGGGQRLPREAAGSVTAAEYVPGDARRYGWEADPNAAAAALRAVMTHTAPDSRITNTVRLLDDVITIPAGTWTLTEIGALMKGKAADGRRHRGLILQGMGRDTTTIVFDPATDGYLFDNQDRMSRMTVRDISFVGGSSRAGFMNSVSNGGPKSMVFERCTWSGTWKYGFNLTGTDNNSEFIFYGCKATGTYDTFFRCDNVQALNHHFLACDIEISTGHALHYLNGGHINIVGGSWIGNIDNPAGTGTGTLIKLSSTDGAPAVNRLYVQGLRVEHRSQTYKLLECAWPSGTVTFESVHDTGYQGFEVADNAAVTRAVFTGAAPVVTFSDCRLSGRHEYEATGQEDRMRRLVNYRSCIIEHQTSLDKFIVSKVPAGRAAAAVPVRFTDCRPGAAVTLGDTGVEVYNQLVNGLVSRNAALELHTVSVKNFQGGLSPADATEMLVTLPLNAVVVGVRAYAPPGASPNVGASWSYALKTSTGAVLNTLQGSTPFKDGFNLSAALCAVLDTDAKRSLSVVPGGAAGGTATSALYLIDYLS